ncbi:hypothetical protein E4U55_007688 [Claviceps digitariae]|nr:hypothetical protein E4U55_007688 [Claviceps digitariae]
MLRADSSFSPLAYQNPLDTMELELELQLELEAGRGSSPRNQEEEPGSACTYVKESDECDVRDVRRSK